MQEHITLSWKILSCPILFHWKYFNTGNSLSLLLWHKPVVWVSSHCSSSSNYLSPLLWFSPAFPHPSCWDWSLSYLMPWAWASTLLFAIFQPLLPGPCSLPDLALKFSLTVNLKRKLPNNWASAVMTLCHTDQFHRPLSSGVHPSVSLSAFIGSAFILQYKFTGTKIFREIHC